MSVTTQQYPLENLPATVVMWVGAKTDLGQLWDETDNVECCKSNAKASVKVSSLLPEKARVLA